MTQGRRLSWPRLAFSRASAAPASSGHGEARFREMLLPHLDAAYRYARILARDEHAAEDIVQDAFLRALRAIDGCRGNPKAWLLAIVRNCFHDWARANGRYLAMETLPEEESDAAAPDEALERAGAIIGVREMVESLPEPFRAALVLRELEEMSYREIAEIMAVPVGTVMSRLARARRMLAELLGVDGADGADDKGAMSR